MKNVLILLVGALLLIGLTTDVVGQSSVGKPIAVTVGTPAAADMAKADTVPVKGILLKVIQRRKLGLTVGNVCRVLKDMKDEGQLAQFKSDPAGDGVESIDVSSLAIAVADRMATENPEGWKDIDWEQVLLVLEKLLELIFKFFPLVLVLF